MSLKDKIKNAEDLRAETITIDEWDVTLEVRAFSARKRLELGRLATDSSGQENSIEFVARLLKESIYDPETHDPVFTDDDVGWLMDKSGAVLDRLTLKAMEVNGLDKASVRDAEKN